MALRYCDVDGCSHPAERTHGSCMICAKHYCFEHSRETYHTCPSEDNPDEYWAAYDAAKTKHLGELLDRINVIPLELVISNIRGVHCYIPVLSPELDKETRLQLVMAQMGGQNCHVDAEFEDGLTWIVRIRLTDPTLPPPEVRNSVLLSEVATLKFLAQTSVPVPKVYHYQPESPDNPVGVSFIVMEKLPGRALNWESTNAEQRKRIMQQLTTIFLELEKYPFHKTGSVIMSDSGFEIGPFTQLSLFTSPSLSLGPWTNLEEAYTAMIHQHIRAIDSQEITKLADKNRGYCQWLLSSLPSLLSSTRTKDGPFYLKHFDDKGDHILVDEQFNITGMIDWEFASTEAKDLAFSAPCMMWPVQEFYDGSNDLSADEVIFAQIFDDQNRRDIGDMVRNGRPWQRFLFFLSGLPTDDVEFDGLFKGIETLFPGIKK